MNELRYAINCDNNIIAIDENGEIIETISIPRVKKILKEKQDLIKYLEQCIEFEKTDLLWTSKQRLKAYQEILDKIKEGNYE